MRLWIAGVVVVSLMLVGGCCAPCHRLGCGLHHHYAGPGAVYGEEPGVVQYHPGPLSWLWRLLGIGRGYPCDDCGPRYWGDWGGDIAGCESCDDYGNWTGMPAVGPRVVVSPSSSSGGGSVDCPECQSSKAQEVSSGGSKPSQGQPTVAAKSDEKQTTRR